MIGVLSDISRAEGCRSQCMLPPAHAGIHSCFYCSHTWCEGESGSASWELGGIVNCIPSYIADEDVERIGVYWMVGKCTNCHQDNILMRFLKERKAHPDKCPVCGVGSDSQYGWDGVGPLRLATPEEIPQ